VRAWRKFAGIVLFAAMLSGCGVGAPRVYQLEPVQVAAKFARRATVRVRIPKAVATLDGDRILQRNVGSSLSLLPDVALGDRLPELVADKVVETLRAAHIRASGERETADVDYDLQLEIKDFVFDATHQNVKVRIAARLVALANGRVVAAKVFSSNRAVPSSDPETVVAALNAALGKTLAAMTTLVAAGIP
jgi:cholesterol transport system auxiliary component